jgi:hypothetical protein
MPGHIPRVLEVVTGHVPTAGFDASSRCRRNPSTFDRDENTPETPYALQ